jgi:hypothetical protein
MSTPIETPTVVLEKHEPLLGAIPKVAKLGIMDAINPILGFVISHWKIALFAIMLLVIYIEFKLIEDYKQDIKNDAAAISALKIDLKQSNDAIADQNKKIDAAKADGDAKQKQLDDLQAKLKAKGIIDQKTINDLRKKPSGTTCDDALKFMNDYIGGVKW